MIDRIDSIATIRELPSAQPECKDGMEDGLILTFDNDGVAELYDDEYDITIHCNNQEEQDKAIELLQREIVLCKDCKYHEDEEPGMVYCPNRVGGWVSEDFFCKDGKRRTDG